MNGKKLSLDFVRKPPKILQVIPSHKYSKKESAYPQPSMPDNPLAQHLHQIALGTMRAHDHLEEIDSTQSPRTVRARVTRENSLLTRHSRVARPRTKHDPKPRAEIPRTILGKKVQVITEQQQVLHNRRPIRGAIQRITPSVNEQSPQQAAVKVSNAVPETPVTHCPRSRVMFAGSTPGAELKRDGPHRPQNDTTEQCKPECDTRQISESQLDSSPMVLTNSWYTCHSAAPHEPPSDEFTDHVPGLARDSTEGTPPPSFKWHVIESLARDQRSPSPLLDECPSVELDDAHATPKQRTIQRLFQQNSYLKRRVRALTSHLLLNKTTFL